MNALQFQFSLNRMLLAVMYYSMAFATLGRALAIWQTLAYRFTALDSIAIIVFPFAFAGLLGAAVGTLFNQTGNGAKLALRYLIGFICVLIADALVIGVAVWIWYWVSMW